MRTKKTPWQMLVDGDIHAVKYADVPDPIVEILPAEEDSLPRLRFTWWKKEYVRIPADASVPAAVSPFLQEDKEQNYWYVWAVADEPEQRCLCNFRRYSWSWTDDPEGHQWYAHGIDYCNCSDAGLACATPEQVVRETLIAAMWMNPEGIPREVMWCRATQDLLPVMLEDALANISEHAETPIKYRAHHGGIGNHCV
jgi:hypothetical protein